MRNDVDYIIDILKKYSTNDTETPEELGEEESAASSSSSGAKPAYPTVTKWESGVSRTGPANQIGLTKWSDIVKINRGKANTLL
jgi:hypothetical protein